MQIFRTAWAFMPLVFTVVSCVATTAPGGDTAIILARERQAAAIAQAQRSQLELEVVRIRAELADRERRDIELRTEQVLLTERVERLLELQQRTYQALTENSSALSEYRELPPLTHRQVEIRAMIRTIDRLGLSPDQKRALLQMLRPPRPLDGENPWKGATEWH
jgi:hypothetical protein